jgi:hypothetical protein
MADKEYSSVADTITGRERGLLALPAPARVGGTELDRADVPQLNVEGAGNSCAVHWRSMATGATGHGSATDRASAIESAQWAEGEERRQKQAVIRHFVKCTP